jgi:hypothetical protein
VPPRGDWRDRDPYWQIWDQVTLDDPNVDFRRTGFLEHRDFLETYESAMNLDESDKRQLWADYNLYMVSHRTSFKRNDPDNPFWEKWHLDPDEDWDWHGWREAMGYPHGNRKS